MRISTRFIVAALAAFTMLAMIAGSASARNRIEVSPTTNELQAPRLTFAGTINVICDVTLNVTLLRLIVKRLGEHAGLITTGRADRCSDSFGGRPTVVVLPDMEITYSSITGTLPNGITGGTLLVTGGFEITLNILGSVRECLYFGRIGARAEENPIRRLGVETTRHGRIPLFADLRRNNCPTSGDLRGEFRPRTAITLRLLEA